MDENVQRKRNAEEDNKPEIETQSEPPKKINKQDDQYSQNHVEKLLQDIPYPEQQTGGINTVPYQSIIDFLGCEEELEKLKTAINNDKNNHNIDVAIHGEFGIGKTELVLKFIKDNRSKFKNLVWIPGESITSFINAFTRLAELFKIIGKDVIITDTTQIVSMIQDIYKNLNASETLIVFDNVLIIDEFEQYLPLIGMDRKNLMIIVTSQFSQWNCRKSIFLEYFTSEISLQFISKYIPGVKDSDEYNELCNKLGRIPLALRIACTYYNHLKQNQALSIELFPECGINFSIEKFTALIFNHSPTLFYNFKFSQFIVENLSLNSCAESIINRIFKCKSGSLATKLLMSMSLMSSENIEAPMFTFINQMHSVRHQSIDNAITLLEKYSLITIDESIISISPFIQFIIRSCIAPFVKEQLQVKLLKWFLNCTDSKNEGKLPYLESKCKPHVLKICLQHESEHLFKQFPLLILASTTIGDSENQLNNLEKVYCQLKSHYDETHLKSQCFYIHILHSNEEYKNANKQCDIVLSKVESKTLESNFYGLKILQYQASSLLNLNNGVEAWKICIKLYPKLHKMNGPNLDTLSCVLLMSKIAFSLDTKGNSEYLRYCLQIFEIVYIELMKSDTYNKFHIEILYALIQYYIQINQITVALNFLAHMKSKFRNKKVDLSDYDGDLFYTDDIMFYIKYQTSVCLMELNQFNEAFEILEEIVLTDDLYLLGYTKMVETFCKIGLRIDTEDKYEILEKCYLAIEYLISDNYEEDKLKETIECIQLIEMEFVTYDLSSHIFFLYNKFAMLRDESSRENNDGIRIRLFIALYHCKLNQKEEATKIYEYMCRPFNNVNPIKCSDMANLVQVITRFEKDLSTIKSLDEMFKSPLFFKQ